MVVWRLLYPLRYFRLQNAEKKSIDWIATMVLTAAIACPFVLIPGSVFFKNGGFLDKIITLTSALTGFYVAALVAAATFSHPDLDKTITAGPIALITKDADGTKVSEALTRREFVCTIFGYLAFLALVMSVLSSIAIGMSDADFFKAHSNDSFVWYGSRIGVILFSVMAGHLVVATSLGLYYLMDRLYRRDRQIATKKNDRAAA